ncbi:MAG: hypothetical protein AAF518_24020, partial [Spirochaetota bacterium]
MSQPDTNEPNKVQQEISASPLPEEEAAAPILLEYNTEHCEISARIQSDDPIIQKMQFRKKDVSHPSYDNIYQPSSTRITNLLRIILKYIYDRQVQIVKLHGFELHPDYYLNLESIHEKLSHSKNLSEHDRSPKAVSDALKQMVNFFEGGKVKLGYIYPYLTQHENKIKTNIVLISPQIEKQTPLPKYRKACFLASLDIIRKVLKRKHDMQNTSPNLLFGSYKGQSWLVPQKGAIEFQMTSLIRRAFKPFEYIPQTDFLEDFLEYGIESDQLLPISSQYHIADNPIELNDNGSLRQEPELLFQYRMHAYSLEKFVQDFLYPESQKRNFLTFQGRFEEYLREYPEEDLFSQELPDKEKLADLFAIIYEFPFVEADNADLYKARESCELAVKILKSIFKHIESFHRKKDQMILKNFIKVQEKRIREHTVEKKTLMIMDIDALLRNSGLQSKRLIE